MKRALIFILYHPGSLVEYKHIRDLYRDDVMNILVVCRHPYFHDEIFDVCRNSFEHVLVLPDINYETNIFAGFLKYFSFKRDFRNKIEPVISGIGSFSIISDCSAYLPVNALLTHLQKNKKCRNLISIRQDYCFNPDVHIRKTLRSLFYTTGLRLQPVYTHRTYSYLYIKEPRDKIINVLSPYSKSMPIVGSEEDIPVYFIYRPAAQKDDLTQNIIIVYTDTDVQLMQQSILSEGEYKERVRDFFVRLSDRYKGCRIICKPHPQDKGRMVSEVEGIPCEVYKGGLTSQMHLDIHIHNVKACYSVSSTSLLYSASLGIPSYTLYKYFEFGGSYPKKFFENDENRDNPYLYNITNLDEIGIIDSVDIKHSSYTNKKDLLFLFDNQ